MTAYPSKADKRRDDAERLRELGDEANRIAASLARLSAGMGLTAPASAADGLPDVDAQQVRALARDRRVREKFFPADLFADPAWDILLDLFQAELSQLRVTVSSLCAAAYVPPTTALRWIKMMTAQGFLVRRPDPHDSRRVFVELSDRSSTAMRRYFSEISNAKR